MWITHWLTSRNTIREPEMADIKDIITDDVVRAALKSDAVTAAVKAQIKAEVDIQIDAAVDAALADVLGADAEQSQQ